MEKVRKSRIGFIGFGHMAEVLLQAMFQSKMIQKSQVLFLRKDKKKQKETSHKWGITAASLKDVVEKSDFCFLCVKPDQVKNLLKEVKEVPSHVLWISIVSGVPISYFEKLWGEKTQILRVMPNTPSEIGEGMNLFTFSKAVTSEGKSQAKLLFSSTGMVEEVPESAIDPLTAISGSGPAYVFKLIEAFKTKAKESGISSEQAEKIVAQTFKGASSLLLKKKNLEGLIQGIAIPGGTTEAGLKVFTGSSIQKDIHDVLEACSQKAKEFHAEFR